MGDEYPTTFFEGELTDPKRAQSHSFCRDLRTRQKLMDGQRIVIWASMINVLDSLIWQSHPSPREALKPSNEVNESGRRNIRSQCFDSSLCSLIRIPIASVSGKFCSTQEYVTDRNDFSANSISGDEAYRQGLPGGSSRH